MWVFEQGFLIFAWAESAYDFKNLSGWSWDDFLSFEPFTEKLAKMGKKILKLPLFIVTVTTVLSDENVKISNEQNLYQIWIFKIDEGKPKIEMSEVKNGQSM